MKAVYLLITITGLVLAGSEATSFATQVLVSLAGLGLFLVGGRGLLTQCKKEEGKCK